MSVTYEYYTAVVVLRSARSPHHLLDLDIGVFSEACNRTAPCHGSLDDNGMSGQVHPNSQSLDVRT